MYVLKPGVKKDPRRRWMLPDRIFFGHGACHILAGVFLERPPLGGFYAERIVPVGPYPGNHVYVTDGTIAFDFHGYSKKSRLTDHHRRTWFDRDGHHATIMRVDFDLLSTFDLNARKMLGPDQYFGDVMRRASGFLGKMDHVNAYERARAAT